MQKEDDSKIYAASKNLFSFDQARVVHEATTDYANVVYLDFIPSTCSIVTASEKNVIVWDSLIGSKLFTNTHDTHYTHNTHYTHYTHYKHYTRYTHYSLYSLYSLYYLYSLCLIIGSYSRSTQDRDRLSAFATGFIFLQVYLSAI